MSLYTILDIQLNFNENVPSFISKLIPLMHAQDDAAIDQLFEEYSWLNENDHPYANHPLFQSKRWRDILSNGGGTSVPITEYEATFDGERITSLTVYTERNKVSDDPEMLVDWLLPYLDLTKKQYVSRHDEGRRYEPVEVVYSINAEDEEPVGLILPNQGHISERMHRIPTLLNAQGLPIQKKAPNEDYKNSMGYAMAGHLEEQGDTTEIVAPTGRFQRYADKVVDTVEVSTKLESGASNVNAVVSKVPTPRMFLKKVANYDLNNEPTREGNNRIIRNLVGEMENDMFVNGVSRHLTMEEIDAQVKARLLNKRKIVLRIIRKLKLKQRCPERAFVPLQVCRRPGLTLRKQPTYLADKYKFRRVPA